MSQFEILHSNISRSDTHLQQLYWNPKKDPIRHISFKFQTFLYFSSTSDINNSLAVNLHQQKKKKEQEEEKDKDKEEDEEMKPTALCSSDSTDYTDPSPYKSLYFNPLPDTASSVDKENSIPASLNIDVDCCDNANNGNVKKKASALKPTSLQLCVRVNESMLDPVEGLKMWDPPSSSMEAWEFSDNEAAPAASWATLNNRSLLCRPLPLDVGRCTCVIVKEKAQGLKGVYLYSLYTNEGQGRQDRKLAVAWHQRHNGRSEFIIAMNANGIMCRSDDNFLGSVTANLMGSRYRIWDQGRSSDSIKKQSSRLLGVISFVPTISSWTGSFRCMRAWIPKHQSLQLRNTTQIQHITGLPKDWEQKRNKCHQLFSKVPFYNNSTKRYELDFREKTGKTGNRIQTSVKNFQLTTEENGKQQVLQFGRVGKSKYVMDFRHPLTGYQAFCMCLSSIDSKLCCSV